MDASPRRELEQDAVKILESFHTKTQLQRYLDNSLLYTACREFEENSIEFVEITVPLDERDDPYVYNYVLIDVKGFRDTTIGEGSLIIKDHTVGDFYYKLTFDLDCQEDGIFEIDVEERNLSLIGRAYDKIVVEKSRHGHKENLID